ncbi:extracellular triacylglycerol lipase precursor [Moniliophthora roreri MCA 2997]|uniref:Carboxylic ester hydrolase n=2 Tax=Moniliophthora roreri TaxID=221103 RepID=V2X5P2_MONRO|nr:extracellular triacylglycerol lipase precursor [Moniliophthora roreri MCA 2997]KAI3608927.1 extracellular triacylglycerol lipase precursor [Moniliophthora roreri]
MQRPLKLSASFLLLASLVSAATVKLGNTTIIGEDITTKGLEFYGGIPFAEPPVGSLRLKPPVLKTSLDTPIFNASTFGAECLQVPIFDSSDLSNIPLSEDCLNVNVIRPAGIEPNTSLPIMMYVFGGGFLADTPPHLNGSAIVARSIARGTPVIYVDFNYRTGPLGFPVGAEAAEKGALNLGLRDQLAAMEWVQQNIAAFGGDKDKVTLFGISAGSISISIHFLNPNLQKYARAAILESGIAGTTLTFNATRRQEDWDNFIAAIPECQDADQSNVFDCLRRDDLNTTHVLQAIRSSLDQADEQFPFVPTLDGPGGLFPELPSEILKKDQFSKIPFITGNTLDEGTLFTAPINITNEGTLREALIGNLTLSPGHSSPELDAAVDAILELYPDIPALGCPFNTGNETFGLSTTYKRTAAIYNDLVFHFPRRSWTRTFAQAGIKTYGYQLSYPELNPAPALGVAHGSDLGYVFGFASFPPSFVPSSSATRVSEQIIDYWVSFATSLDPNDGLGSDRPIWPEYTIDNPVLLQLNGSSTGPLLDNYRNEQFEFVDSHPVIFRH